MTTALEHAAAPRARSPWRSLAAPWPRREHSGAFAGLALALVPVAAIGWVGADARWPAALGALVTRGWRIPVGLPFAGLPSAGWHNVPVLAELVFHWLDLLGQERALLGAQLAAVATALFLVQRDARREGADDRQLALLPPLVMLAAAPALLVVRLQLFSLVCFPLLLALLRSDARRPSRRIWLAPALLALWANLHGAVLVGLAAFACYLACERLLRTPFESVLLAAAGMLGLVATPALLQTPAYFYAVLGNEAARRGVGLWAPPSLSFWDVLLVGVGGLLFVCALRARPRPRLFELLLFAGLALMTAHAARAGVWLVLALAAPAARALPRATAQWRPTPVVPALLLLACVVLGLGRGPARYGAGEPLLRQTLALAAGRPLLADDALAEQVALGGGRIWVGNPIDAFARPLQRQYIAWLLGKPAGDPLLRRSTLVLVRRGGASERRLRSLGGFTAAAGDTYAVLYRRSGR